jgi:hypothetical protein
MHILFVNHAPIPVFAYGGTERVIWDLGKSLVGLGHRVSYLVPQGSHCDFAQVLAIREGVDWASRSRPMWTWCISSSTRRAWPRWSGPT